MFTGKIEEIVLENNDYYRTDMPWVESITFDAFELSHGNLQWGVKIVDKVDSVVIFIPSHKVKEYKFSRGEKDE